MNLERVVFGFFIILALALNFVFVMGDIDDSSHHNVWILTIAILVNLIATGLKLGDRTQVGALLLAEMKTPQEKAIEAMLKEAVNIKSEKNLDWYRRSNAQRVDAEHRRKRERANEVIKPQRNATRAYCLEWERQQVEEVRQRIKARQNN